jgi:hypothetical protein
MSKKFPYCGLNNPNNTMICDCGYNLEKKYNSAISTKKSKFTFAIIFIGFINAFSIIFIMNFIDSKLPLQWYTYPIILISLTCALTLLTKFFKKRSSESEKYKQLAFITAIGSISCYLALVLVIIYHTFVFLFYFGPLRGLISP